MIEGSDTSVRHAKGAGWVVLPDGQTAYPSAFVARVALVDAPLVAELWVSVDPQGRAECRRLALEAADGGPVTVDGLRSVPLARLIRIAKGAAAQKVRRAADGSFELAPMRAPETYAARRQPRPQIVGGSYEDREARASEIYNAAMKDGRPPLQAVADELAVSRSTAGRIVRAAKAHGLIHTTRGEGR
jgi:hypothetical protein